MQQHVIPFNKGIHLTPSASEDGQLADCINLIPKDGSLRNTPVISDLQTTLAEGHTLAYIHHVGTQSNIITFVKSTNSAQTSYYLHPATTNPILTLTTAELYRITSIGNTLIFITSEGMHYLLWKVDHYVDLGTHLPEPKIEFKLASESDATSRKKDIAPDFDPLTFVHEGESTSTHAYNTIGIKEEYQTPFNNAIYGEVNRLLNEEVTEKGYFANPFYVRYAYRLYDGSLVMHSAPIFIDKSFGITVVSDHEKAELESSNPDVYDYWGLGEDLNIHIVHHIGDEHTYPDGTSSDDTELDQDLWWNFNVKRFTLQYQITNLLTDIQAWSDIIKSVDIFISQPFYLYDQSGKIEKVHHEISEEDSKHEQWVYVDLPPVEHQDELINDCGQFYFVKSISVNEMDNTPHDLDVKGYLEALAAREQMTDDYDSHDTLIPQYSFVYNQRLNIANIDKRLFEGFNADIFCMPPISGYKLRMSVTYHTPQKDISFLLNEIDGIALPTIWHYYIPSQYPVTLKIVVKTNLNALKKKQVELTAHRFLNGYYAAIPIDSFDIVTGTTFDALVQSFLETTSDSTITLPNKLYTSEINNPFFFPVSGINTIGIGEIKGICSAVKALSTGQFGQFPLYVFSTDGIWALQVRDDGTYSVKQPVTRDVLDNPNSITQLDTAVLYTTKRGLNLIQGSDTRLLTAQLEASIEDLSTLNSQLSTLNSQIPTLPSLLTILPTARLSYDGINNIVHIYPFDSYGNPVTPTPTSHYILHLDTMQWARTTQPIPVAFVDGYPNATLQINVTTTADNVTTTTAKLYQYALPTYSTASLQAGFLLTRETALGDPHTYKLLYDLRTLHHYRATDETTRGVKVLVLVSNDRTTWQPLRSLKSRSFLWYRFAIFTNLADSDILEALTLQTDDRRTNKLR